MKAVSLDAAFSVEEITAPAAKLLGLNSLYSILKSCLPQAGSLNLGLDLNLIRSN